MRWPLFALLVFSSVAAAADRRVILLLHRSGAAAREAPLYDALRIYTRDLGRGVIAGSDAPATLTQPELELAAAAGKRAGADIVVWFGGEAESPGLYALRVETMDLRGTAVDRADIEESSRTLALKVRALLSRREGIGEDDEWFSVLKAPAESAAPVAAPPPAPAPAPAPVEKPASAPTVVAIAPTPAQKWIEASVAYSLEIPGDPSWLRQGVALRAAVIVGRLPLALFADFALSVQPSSMVAGTRFTIADYPIGLGALLRWRHDRLRLSGGLRGTLHLIDAYAVVQDAEVQHRFMFGVGLLGQAAYMFSESLGVLLAIAVDVFTRDEKFTVGGLPAADLGPAQLGASLGFLFAGP